MRAGRNTLAKNKFVRSERMAVQRAVFEFVNKYY